MAVPLSTSVIKKAIWNRYSHTWFINNLKQLWGKSAGYYKDFPKFTSDDKKCKLNICFYANGLDEACESFISLQLYFFPMPPTEQELHQVSLTILDSNRQMIKSVTFRETYSNKQTKREFMKKEDLRSRVGNDDIYICSVVYLKVADIENEKEENFQLDPPLGELRLALNFGELLDNGKYSDIMVACSDGIKINAHKLVLATRSPVFAAMLNHDMLEKKSGRIKISDCDSDVVQLLLRFIYSGKIIIPNFPVAIELLNLAEKYHIPDLKSICISYLANNLDTSNACTTILLSCKEFAKTLKDPASNFIIKNFESFSKAEILNLAANIPQQLFAELMVEVSKRLHEK